MQNLLKDFRILHVEKGSHNRRKTYRVPNPRLKEEPCTAVGRINKLMMNTKDSIDSSKSSST